MDPAWYDFQSNTRSITVKKKALLSKAARLAANKVHSGIQSLRSRMGRHQCDDDEGRIQINRSEQFNQPNRHSNSRVMS